MFKEGIPEYPRLVKMAAKRRKIHNVIQEYSEEDSCSEEKEDSDSDDEDEIFSYTGSHNVQGNPHGRGTMTWIRSKNRFEGHFTNGTREGKGCFYFADGSSLSGYFKKGNLDGIGLYTYPDGSFLKGTYVNGDLNGFCEEYDAEHRPTFEGNYQNGVRCGFIKTYDEFGGSVVGTVDDSGALTGDDCIAYVYPDGATALVGAFSDGKMVSARPVHLRHPVEDCLPDHDVIGESPYITVGYDESTSKVISTSPLVPDVYEQERVYIAPSLIPAAGEGLFAKQSLLEGEIVSFYNGIRITHAEVDTRDWSVNNNTLSLDESTVIDVPEEYSTTDAYCASLGHKANHSFNPNCEYTPFHHPRFGYIKCIRTLCCVNKGEELTCNYGYNHKIPTTDTNDVPKWYFRRSEKFITDSIHRVINEK